MARALRETRIHGVTTNRELLIGILREPEFLSGAIDTGYLQRHDPAQLMAAKTDPTRIHAAVAALAAQAGRRRPEHAAARPAVGLAHPAQPAPGRGVHRR